MKVMTNAKQCEARSYLYLKEGFIIEGYEYTQATIAIDEPRLMVHNLFC